MTTDEAIANSPDLATVLGDEHRCVERIAALWRSADVLPAYPATTATVVELLRAGGGYDVNCGLLEEWVRRGMVPGVAMRAGRFAWSAQNILTAMIHADTWKRWIPLDPRHIHKMSAVELNEAQAGKLGKTAFTDLDQFDVAAFVVMLERCDDPQLRHLLAVGLRTKLARLGVIDK